MVVFESCLHDLIKRRKEGTVQVPLFNCFHKMLFSAGKCLTGQGVEYFRLQLYVRSDKLLFFSVPLLNAAVSSISISGYDGLCVWSVL